MPKREESYQVFSNFTSAPQRFFINSRCKVQDSNLNMTGWSLGRKDFLTLMHQYDLRKIVL